MRSHRSKKKKKTKKEIQHRNTRGRHNQPLANFSFTCLTQDTNQMASTKVKNNKAMQLEDKSCFPVMPGNSGSVSRMAIMQVVLKEWCQGQLYLLHLQLIFSNEIQSKLARSSDARPSNHGNGYKVKFENHCSRLLAFQSTSKLKFLYRGKAWQPQCVSHLLKVWKFQEERELWKDPGKSPGQTFCRSNAAGTDMMEVSGNVRSP